MIVAMPPFPSWEMTRKQRTQDGAYLSRQSGHQAAAMALSVSKLPKNLMQLCKNIDDIIKYSFPHHCILLEAN